MVKGVEFLIDDNGQKKAVLIDLKKYGGIWEDFYDTLRVKARESEPRERIRLGLQSSSYRPPRL